MKQELPTKKAIEEAIIRVRDAMFENIEASQEETQAQMRKKKAHYNLLQAQESLRALQLDLMTGLNI